MSLKVTQVSQCLEKRLEFWGFEIPDLLFILVALSVLNFLLGALRWKIFYVWIPTAALAAVLRFSKHGKPDNYLIHKIKFLIQPKILNAFPDATNFKSFLKRKGIR
jgi:hypothetical protein